MAVVEVAHQFLKGIYGTDAVISEVEREKNPTTYMVVADEVSVCMDKYGGFHVNNAGSLEQRVWDAARTAIEALPGQLNKTADEALPGQPNKTVDSLWVNFKNPVPVTTMGRILPEAFTVGESTLDMTLSGEETLPQMSKPSGLIADIQTNQTRCWLWLNPKKECTIPPGATHNLGATAVLIDRLAGKVLLVENQGRQGRWNFPGGSCNIGESPLEAAKRELEEETGVKVLQEVVKHAPLLGQMEFPNNPFAPAINQSFGFFISNHGEQELKPSEAEISRAKWCDYNAILDAAAKGEKFEGLKLGKEIPQMIKAALEVKKKVSHV
ncbi:MAG: hypothetical protein S4CHLAM45_00770 [Chlamydiales bacterium]|nr:hypothetical protein [Chlamydiales bacterium]MCH9619398.1 hypothetical protein [Chlamydiales bacterium]MCH9622202.1 hypothetical protein [Chlamydiales bacterium]